MTASGIAKSSERESQCDHGRSKAVSQRKEVDPAPDLCDSPSALLPPVPLMFQKKARRSNLALQCVLKGKRRGIAPKEKKLSNRGLIRGTQMRDSCWKFS